MLPNTKLNFTQLKNNFYTEKDSTGACINHIPDHEWCPK